MPTLILKAEGVDSSGVYMSIGFMVSGSSLGSGGFCALGI